MWSVPYADCLSLLLAVFIGGAIGAERELRHKAAGFRTLICICVGATLFTQFSMILGCNGDVGRVAAQIVTGIGFLGAGVIWRDTGRVSGLTTAAAIWLTAALGMGLGLRFYGLVFLVTAVILIVLTGFPQIELFLEGQRRHRLYECTLAGTGQAMQNIRELVSQHGLRLLNEKIEKREGRVIVAMVVLGRPARHDELLRELLNHPDCLSLRS